MARLTMLKPRVQMLGAKDRKPWQHERQSRHERGYGAAWERARKRVLARDCGVCQPCKRAGRTTEAREVDHILPKFEGGTDDDGNLQAICGPCHQAKTAAESARSRAG